MQVIKEKNEKLFDDYESSDAMLKLGSILQCPVCLEVPTSPPIYRCDNGHILCKECKVKLSNCPECRIKLGDKRCLTSEKIVREILFQDTTPISRLNHPCYQVPKLEERLSTTQESNTSNTSWWDVGKYVAIGFAAAVPLALAVSGYSKEKTKKENDKDKRK